MSTFIMTKGQKFIKDIKKKYFKQQQKLYSLGDNSNKIEELSNSFHSSQSVNVTETKK